jgi:acyl carrier protein
MSHTGQLATAQVAEVVTNVLVDTLNLPAADVVPDANLKEDLGLDSLDLLELLAAIEAHVGEPVDDADIGSIRTVGDAVTLIERLQDAVREDR